MILVLLGLVTDHLGATGSGSTAPAQLMMQLQQTKWWQWWTEQYREQKPERQLILVLMTSLLILVCVVNLLAWGLSKNKSCSLWWYKIRYVSSSNTLKQNGNGVHRTTTAESTTKKQKKRPMRTSGGVPIMDRTAQGWSWPYLGHAISFLLYRPWDLLTTWHRLYGPIVGFQLLGARFFSVASPALLKVVLQSQIQKVKKDVTNTYKPFLSILGTGIVTSEAEAWMKQRLKMSHPLRRDVLEMIPQQTVAAVQRFMKVLDEAAETGESVPVGSSLRHLTLQVISGTFLSLSADESDSTFAKMYLPIVDESNLRVWHPYRAWLPFLPSFWKYHINVERLNQYMSRLILRRWDLRQKERGVGWHPERPTDILDGVLKAYEKQFPEATVLPDEMVQQLRDEMKTFMLAGHETSAAMMTWALYELVAHPALMDRVAWEGASVFGPHDWRTADLDDIPSAENLCRLVLAEASLKESLRKYSVVPIVARRTVQDMYIKEGNYFIPKDSHLLINMQAVHHDPEIWPEPMKFDPERFLPGHVQNIKPFTFVPFIAGPRNCLGQYLALLESKMVMGLLTQRYEFRLPPGARVEVNEWTPGKDPRHRFMVPVIPKEEFMVQVSRKKYKKN